MCRSGLFFETFTYSTVLFAIDPLKSIVMFNINDSLFLLNFCILERYLWLGKKYLKNQIKINLSTNNTKESTLLRHNIV